MTVTAIAADGSQHVFPDGTSPAVIDKAMKGYAGYAKARADAEATIQKQPGSPLGKGFDRALDQGGSFGFGDEMSGASAATRTFIGNTIDRMLGKTPAYSVKDAYQATVDAERAADAKYAQDHPVLHGLAEFLPGLAAGPAKGVASVPGMLRQVGSGAAIGAGTGAVAGAGNATEGHRVEGAVRGAAGGAVAGAAVPVIAKGVGGAAAATGNTVARVANAAMGGKLIDPAKTATQKITAALLKDKATPASIAQATADWRATGASDPALMNVAGENTRALVRAAASQGPARNAAVKHAEQVAEDLQDNAINLAKGLKPGAPSVADAEAQLRAARGAQADADYPAFKDVPVPVSPKIVSATSGDAGRSATGYARKLADALRDPVATAEAERILNDPSLSGNISAGTLDLVRRGLRDNAEVADRAGEGTIAGGLRSRSGDLESELMGVPGFDQARTNYRNYSDQIDALAHGQGVLKTPQSDYAVLAGGWSPEAQQAAQTGAVQGLTDAFANPAQGSTGVLNRAATATATGNNLAATFGEDAASQFRQGLANELQKVRDARYISPNTNSQTFSRLEDMGVIDPAKLNPHHLILSSLANVLKGAGLNDAEREAIVQAGLGSADLNTQLTAAMLRRSLPNPAMSLVIPAAAATGQDQNQ